MSADGLDIEPAGSAREGAGHFHLLIDASCDEPGAVTSADATHLRLEDGSDEVDVPLDAGDHTLCLQAADGSHAALASTDEVTVHVAASRRRRDRADRYHRDDSGWRALEGNGPRAVQGGEGLLGRDEHE